MVRYLTDSDGGPDRPRQLQAIAAGLTSATAGRSVNTSTVEICRFDVDHPLGGTWPTLGPDTADFRYVPDATGSVGDIVLERHRIRSVRGPLDLRGRVSHTGARFRNLSRDDRREFDRGG